MNEPQTDSDLDKRAADLATPVERRARRWVGVARARRAFALIILIGLLTLFILTAQAKGVSLERFLSLGVWGVMLGGIIALGGIGISLVYGVLRFANFAHGDFMTGGAYVAFALLPLLPQGAPLKPFSFGWEFLAALLLTMPLIGLSAFLIDRAIYRPLRARRSSAIILAMASLGMAFFVRSLVYLGWGADFRFYYVGRERPALRLPLGIRVRPDQFFILGVALLLVFLLYLLLERTKTGKAMRATADNPELARVSGIDTEKVVFWTWLIGGALAAAGGILLGLNAQLSPMMGWWLLLPLFAAVILGGIGNPYGALVGGLIIGIIQQVSTAFLNPAYAPGVSFLIMIIVLLVRPQGIFGRPGG